MAYWSGYSSTSSSAGSGSSGKRVRTICLTKKPPPARMGFSLRGGKEHNTGFFITAVENNSDADKQGLMVGDQIIRINGYPVDDATHHEVLQLIQCQPAVTLKVKSVGMIPVKESPNDELSWHIVEPKFCDSSHQPPPTEIYKPEICNDNYNIASTTNDVKMVLKVPPRAKLGCGICRGPDEKPGIFVQFTKENSIARNAGLRPGDQILQCNNFIFTPDILFSEAVSVMRCSGVLELIVRKGAGLELFPGESSGYNSSASSVAGDPPRLSILQEDTNIYPTETPGMTRAEYSNGCTVIHVNGNETENKKVAEICMVSQQLETKTTTVLVEVHHSDEDNVSHTPSDTSTDRLTNSSSVSSFTSSASSLSSAISQELERRSKRPPVDFEKPKIQSDKLIKSGLAKEKVEQHELLMQEFRKAHRKMFSNDLPKDELDRAVEMERDNPRLDQPKLNGNSEKPKQDENSKIKRQVAPPPPPPLPSAQKDKPVSKPVIPSIKKYPAPVPPSPPYCPTPDYDTTSLASDEVTSKTNKLRKDPVDMQSLESFKLTNPSKVKPKPPNTYFSKSSGSRQTNGNVATMQSNGKPIITIREYPAGKEKKNPVKFDFLQNIAPPPNGDTEPIGSRFQNELTTTLSRATILSKNETQVTAINQSSQTKGTVVTINVAPHESAKPFFLFPNGAADLKKLNSNKQNGKVNAADNGAKNSVTFNFSNKTNEIRNVNVVQPNGILKNSNNNVSHIQIQGCLNEKIAQQKTLKFGGI